MCLITKQREAVVAAADIVVYKLFIRDSLTTLHRNYTYESDGVHQTEFTFSDDLFVPLDYKVDDWLWETYPDLRPDWSAGAYHLSDAAGCISVQQGFHSYGSTERAKYNKTDQYLQDESNVVIRACIIPTGSLYYEDETGLLVSNQIIIKEIVS